MSGKELGGEIHEQENWESEKSGKKDWKKTRKEQEKWEDEERDEKMMMVGAEIRFMKSEM